MNHLIQQRARSGNELAAQAAMLERDGLFETAAVLWSNAMNFPCKYKVREYRQNRSDACRRLAELRPQSEVQSD
ncbi:ANR family transcriptional regulator [Klebsiella aerogenes]|nr:ANR family transcriptional regulator [Klebsiella aerogenes]